MTLVRVNKDNLDEYEEFIKKHPKGLFQHSSKWAKVKSAWKFEAIMLKNDSGEIKGSAAVLIDRKSTRLNSSHITRSRMPSSA